LSPVSTTAPVFVRIKCVVVGELHTAPVARARQPFAVLLLGLLRKFPHVRTDRPQLLRTSRSVRIASRHAHSVELPPALLYALRTYAHTRALAVVNAAHGHGRQRDGTRRSTRRVVGRRATRSGPCTGGRQPRRDSATRGNQGRCSIGESCYPANTPYVG